MSGLDDFDHELYEQIEELVDSGDIELGTPSYGVAQKVIYEGYESLTPKQRHVYDKFVAPLLADDHEDEPE